MTNVWVVRADGGMFTDHFVKGGYAGIGWDKLADLSGVTSREELYPLIQAGYAETKSAYVIGNYVGQVARFLLEIKPGDYIITPTANTEWLRYGVVGKGGYYYSSMDDGCVYQHRRPVTWANEPVRRGDFSVPLQNALRATLTVFAVSQRDEFLAAVGEAPPSSALAAQYDAYAVVLGRILTLDDKEFEILVGHLLTALGFEGSEITGKSGDGGVDATGELNVANLAKVKVFVQAKRYKTGTKVSASVVRQLRQAIPFGGQGAFITTGGFQAAAADVAIQDGFPRIGLVNGNQLVDLLVEHWDDVPTEFRERLGLKPGLVLA